MAARTTVRSVVRKILTQFPGSIRALARVSGVDHGTLIKIRDGKLGLSDDAASRLIDGLRKFAKQARDDAATMDSLAKDLADAIEQRHEGG